ncbi:MAG: lysozyme inhibitor LprI family protein [Pseudomonadota bacterium]
MPRVRPVLALVIATSLAHGASAAEINVEREYSADYARCLASDDAARGVTPAMAGCINEELARQDRRLNTAYAAAMKARGPKGRAALRAVQRRWIRDRDAECAANLTGGTIDRIEQPACHLSLTTERAVELERMAR